MIKHLRIDNRLIHGQVAVTWMSYIDAKSIIVCNDDVAADPIQKMTLPLAARGRDVKVFSVEETLNYAKEHADETLFVICKFPSDALRILQSDVPVEDVNVGNAAPIAGTEYVMVTKSIAVTKEEAEVYRKIEEVQGKKLYSQLLPSYTQELFIPLLKKAGL